jgi:hypothetical protein
MKLKHVKLYRPVTINGLARESVYLDSVTELRYLVHLNMIICKDKRNVPILVPLTNVEHMIPDEADFNKLDKAFTEAMGWDGVYHVECGTEVASEVSVIEAPKKKRRMN